MSAPWMKFYPSDWRADPALRMCSIGARGLWMELLCLMHEATPRGSLLINGKGVNPRQIASLAGSSVDEVQEYLEELEGAGVFSVEEDGTIFSRRMRRDEERAAGDKANGRKGGNPKLKGVNPSSDKGVNPPDKAQKPEARDQKEGSDANASAAVAAPIPPEYPIDPTERLWAEGRDCLKAMGLNDRSCGSNIGRWRSQTKNDDRRILDAIRQARDMGTRDPIPLVSRLLQPNNAPIGGRRGNSQDAVSFAFEQARLLRLEELSEGSGDGEGWSSGRMLPSH